MSTTGFGLDEKFCDLGFGNTQKVWKFLQRWKSQTITKFQGAPHPLLHRGITPPLTWSEWVYVHTRWPHRIRVALKSLDPR